MNDHNNHNGRDPAGHAVPPIMRNGSGAAAALTGLTAGATVARLVLLGAVILVLYLAREILAPFIIAAALAYIFSPVVGQIQERTRLPRIAVVALFYVIIIAGLVAGISLVETRLVRELRVLDARGPDLVDQA